MTKPVVVEGEHGRKFTLTVPKSATVEKIRIDEGLVRGNQSKKCDWAIKVNPGSREHFFFVELKGGDLAHAVRQLESSIIELKHLHEFYGNKQAHAVCSRIIPSFSSQFQVAVKNFKDKHGFLLRRHSQAGQASCG